MQKIKTIFFFLIGLCLTIKAFADDFKKDQDLVDQLKAKHIKLIIVRQGEASNNSEVIISSSTSPGYFLTGNGIQQVIDLENELRSQAITKIFTSPLFRCLQTTQMFGVWFELPHENLIVDDRLVIQGFGNYEGMGYHSYEKLFPSKNAMLESDLNSAESGFSVYQRSLDFLWNIADNYEEETILVVTHAFNCCHIKKCLTGCFGKLPVAATYTVYDYTTP